MTSDQRASWRHATTGRAYATACVLVGLCATARWALNPLLEHEGVYLTFMIPVAASAYVGGRGPGFLSAGLSALLAGPYVTDFPVPHLAASLTHATLFLVEAAAIVGLVERLRQSRWRAEAALREAEAARQMAEEASRAREQFMARVSHEWRGPLTAMTGWLAQLEQRSTDPAFVTRATASMTRAIDTQSRFVADLLDYSRGRQGKMSFEPRRIAVAEPVRRAVEAATLTADERGVEIRFREETINARVWGDAVRLQQVFSNLLQNATKLTPAGGSIEISSVCLDGAVDVHVTDSGIGISADALPTLFDRSLRRMAHGTSNTAAWDWVCPLRRRSSTCTVGR